jgi:hypothetical protein
MNQYLNYLYYIVISIVLIYAYYKLKKYIIEYRLKKSLAEVEKVDKQINTEEENILNKIEDKKNNIKNIKEKIKKIENNRDNIVNENKTIETDIKKISKKLKNL